MDRLIPGQLQQTWSRILFGTAGLIYLWAHGDFLAQYETLFLASVVIYFTYNALTLYAIKQSPLSAFRMLFGPLLDVWVVGLAMLVDGGQASGLFLVFFIIIFGNAVRFGNAMLLYSQALSIVGIITVSVITLFGLHLELDGTLLFMQCLALVVVPAYVLQIKKQANLAIQAKQDAENATFGLLDHGPLPAFTFHMDDEGIPRILYANLAMQNVYRDSTISLIGEQVDILALMEDGDEIIRACQHIFADNKNPEPYRFYIRGRDASDQILQLMGQSMRLHWHSKWIGVCFLLDITQAEAARNELEQSIHNSYMNTLVAGIVHDFRNILTSIIGTAEVMSFSSKEEETQSQLKLIMDAGERGSAMISHLLSLSKVEHEHSGTAPTTGVIHQSLASIVGLLRIQLPPHTQLHLDIQSELPAVSISITEIEQIVTNLINNSAQAIPKTGHIWVSLSSSDKNILPEADKPALAIHVRDDGNGIPKDDIAEITKPFWTSRKTEGGTGLGLAMVQRIVRDNRGIMDIQSEPGKGTDIHIYLPMKSEEIEKPKQTTPADPALHQESAPETELTPKPATILLVDDSPSVLLVHTAQLERMGHTILTATDGLLGLQEFELHADSIDMIITDYKMPKMDGMEFSMAIRDKSADLPILIITAYGETAKLQKTKELDIRILNKPATFRKLCNTIAIMQDIK
ncbi:MAG: ATP-binding protein [Mariprofundaceae bacterium]